MGVSPNSLTSPWISNGTVTSPEARLALGASWMKSPSSPILAETGVVEGSTPSASISSNSVIVTAHHVVVEATGGTHVCTTAVSMTCPLDTPLPSSGQSRFDLIVAEIVDTADSATYRLRSVTGVAAGSPSVPATPANTVALFRVPVTNSGPQTPVAIFGYTRAPGGIRLVRAGDTRAGSYVGDLRKFDTGQIDVWRGGQWDTVVAPAAWTQFTPTLYSSGSGTAQVMGSGGSAIGRYLIAGKVMHLRYAFRRGTTGFSGGWGDIYTQLPAGVTSAPAEETHILAKLNAHTLTGNALAGIWMGKCFIPPSSNRMNLYFPISGARSDLTTYRYSDSAQGNPGTGFPQVAGDYPTPGILVIQGTIEIS